MTFANPLLLAGLAAAVLPIVLHLLGRARARPLPWGATMFLTADTGDAFAGRLRDRLLLLARCAAIALLALAFARPGPASAELAATEKVVVLVIDASPSTLHPETSSTRFELIRQAALDRLRRLKQGDQAALVVLGSAVPSDLALTPDLQAIVSQLLSLAPGPLPADLAEGERRARAILNDNAIDGGEVDLIADRQRGTWEPLRQTVDLAGGTKIVALPIGTTRNDNCGIESITLLNPPALAGRAARFAIALHNDGEVPQGELTLRLSPGRGAADSGAVAIAAHGRTQAFRTVIPQRAGSAYFTATLTPTGMPDDDVVRQSMDVLSPPRVRWLGATDATTQPTNLFEGVDVAVLAGTAPDLATLAAIEQFVAAGGGLMIAPGPAVTPAAWNQRFWKGGFGLASFAAADVQDAAAEWPAGIASFLMPSADAPDWTKLSLTRHWKLAAVGGETVVARLGKDPLVIERRFGRGRVTVLAVPLDGQWTRGGDAKAYQALIDLLTPRLMAPPNNRNIDIGVPMESAYRVGRERAVTVTRPDGRSDRVSLVTSGSQLLFRYTRTDLPGRYAVRGADQPAEDWFVRPDPGEANLSLLDDKQLAELLRPTGIELQGGPVEVRPAPNAPSIVLLAALGILLSIEIWLAGGYLPRRERP